MVADDPNSVDLEGDDGGVTGEEIRTDSGDELIVPGRVFGFPRSLGRLMYGVRWLSLPRRAHRFACAVSCQREA